MDLQELYRILQSLPRGKVITYGDLAARLGNRAWARAVGNALHRNPDGDTVPCYKVVNRQGKLSKSYAFGGPEEQKRRLQAEGIAVEEDRVDLTRYGIQ